MELAWEADLWERLSSRSKAAILEAQASRDDLEAIALVLSAQVAEVYYQIIEQQLQLALLEGQIETGEKFYALTKLRFAKLVQPCVCPPDMPVCTCPPPEAEYVTRRAVRVSDTEISRNPRARSARVRAVRRIR